MNNYIEISDRLFERYYQNGAGSSVTSSYWKEYGGRAVAGKGSVCEPRGEGFGFFIRPFSLRHAQYVIYLYLAGTLLDKYNVDKEVRLAGEHIAQKQKRMLDLDCIRQILTVNMLRKEHLFDRCRTVCVIGDGYGFMTSLLKLLYPRLKIVCVNLGRILFFDAHYIQKTLPEEKVILAEETIRPGDISNNGIIFVEAERYDSLHSLPIDLFINICSMQEMDMGVINKYFDIMRSGPGERYFYCCNRIAKVLPDGTTIKFFGYPWSSKDEMMIDELCPWCQTNPSYRPYPPFWKPFDGPVQHRLVKLSV